MQNKSKFETNTLAEIERKKITVSANAQENCYIAVTAVIEFFSCGRKMQ